MILKIFMAYLNEGVKVFFRISYAICYVQKESILSKTDKTSIKETIASANKELSLINSHQLLRVGYTLTLTEMRKSFTKSEVQGRQIRKSKTFFRPRFNQTSNIILDDKVLVKSLLKIVRLKHCGNGFPEGLK